jgi:hypothetical protein
VNQYKPSVKGGPVHIETRRNFASVFAALDLLSGKLNL